MLAGARNIYTMLWIVGCLGRRHRARGILGTSYGRLFVLLEVIVDESQNQRGLFQVKLFPCVSPSVTHVQPESTEGQYNTFPTAASPRSTSLTLLLGFGVFALVGSDMVRTVPKRL